MEYLKDFFKRRCQSEQNESNIVHFKTDFEQIKFDSEDDTFNPIRYIHINNIVRFLNPKVNFKKNILPDLQESLLEGDDFDLGIEVVNSREIESEEGMLIGEHGELKYLYFLPTHIEEKIKQITKGGKRKKIDLRLKSIIPSKYIEELNLQFDKTVENPIIEYEIREDYSTSFYKFFNEEDKKECTDFREIEKKVNTVKYKLGTDFIESMNYYLLGDISSEIGLIERNLSEEHDNPLYYHLNMWKLFGESIDDLCNNFKLYPFSKEVIEDGN